MTEHNILLNAQTHEPKHITDAVTGDAGKVITPSSTVSGTSDIRVLTPAEVGVLSHYGEMEVIQNSTVKALTAATDTTLYTASDYSQITGLFTAGVVDGITFATDELTVPITGIYSLYGWANVTFSVNNPLIGLKFTLNGVTVPPVATPTLRRKLGTGADVASMAGTGLVSLTAGDSIGISTASSLTGNLTITDGNVFITLVKDL